MTDRDPAPSPAIVAYLAALSRHLGPLPADDRDDVVREIAAHLADGVAGGADPEAVINRLGPAAEVADRLRAERLVGVDRQRSAAELMWLAVGAAMRPFLIGLLGVLALMLTNSLYLYAELLMHGEAEAATVAALLAYNVPAILQVSLPMAMLCLGLVGVPAIARAVSAATFKRLRWPIGAAIGAVGLVTSLGSVAFGDLAVVPANRANVDMVKDFLLHQPRSIGDYPDERSPQELTRAALAARIARRQQEIHDGPVVPDPTLATELRNLEVDQAYKVSIPFMNAAMALLGLALGLAWGARRQTLLGILAVFVPLVCLDYALLSATRHSDLPAETAAWAPTMFMALQALAVFALAGLVRREAPHV